MVEPSEVKAKAERVEESNYKFRSFLKAHADEDKLDKQFLDLHNELFAGYDCGKCRNCCREYAATLSEEDIEQIAAFLQMSRDDFVGEFIKDGDDGHELEEVPCRFLSADNACKIESCKPQNCVEYPYTDKPERLSSLLGIIWSASVCPVVFEIIERLKVIYGFRSRR